MLILQAIGNIHHPHGTSRAAIANWIIQNCNKERGAMFNAHLRKALSSALEKGILKQGSTQSRYKLGEKSKQLRNEIQNKSSKPKSKTSSPKSKAKTTTPKSKSKAKTAKTKTKASPKSKSSSKKPHKY